VPDPFTDDCPSGALVIGFVAWGANAAIPGGAGGRTTSAIAATRTTRATLTAALTPNTTRPVRALAMPRVSLSPGRARYQQMTQAPALGFDIRLITSWR
jgi:hypothetical protein